MTFQNYGGGKIGLSAYEIYALVETEADRVPLSREEWVSQWQDATAQKEAAEAAQTAAETAKTEAEAAQAAAETARDNAQAKARTTALWTDLFSLSGSVDREGAEVLDSDTGTHLDATATGYDGPVVPNGGGYSWIDAWSRWAWIGGTGLSGKADQSDVDDALDLKLSITDFSTSIREAALIQLANVGGTANAATADLPDVTGYQLNTNATMMLVWPATNTADDPTLTVGGYTITFSDVVAGELIGGTAYIVRFVSNVGFDAVGAVVGSTTIADINGLQTALDAKASTTQLTNTAKFAGIPQLGNVAGTANAVTADVTSYAYGYAIHSTSVFVVKWPETNTAADPTLAVTDSVATYTYTLSDVAAGQLVANQFYIIAHVSNTIARVVGAKEIAEINGLQSALDGKSSTGALTNTGKFAGIVQLDSVAGTANAVTANVTSHAYGYTVHSASKFIVKWPETNTAANPTLAVTDSAATYTYTLSGIAAGQLVANRYYIIAHVSNTIGRVVGPTTIAEINGLQAALDAAGDETAAPGVKRFATRADAAAATIAATVDFVEVQSYSDSTPAAVAAYARSGSSATGSFTSADGAHWVPAWSVTRPQMLGAICDGATNDNSAWYLCTTLGKPIWVDEGHAVLVTDYSNTMGVPVAGPGRVIAATTDGYIQHNSARPFGAVENLHFLSPVKSVWAAGGDAKVVIVGNSKATNSYGLNITDEVRDVLRGLGLGVDTVVNEAVGGTSPGDTDIAAILTDLGSQYDLMICMYDGANMSGTDMADIETNTVSLRNALRSDMAAVRAHMYGGEDDLAVLQILSPPMENTATSAENNKNGLWIEAINGMMRATARDYRAAVYDPSHEMHAGNGEAGRTLDGYGVHPNALLSRDIWGRALTATCAPMGGTKRNRSLNLSASETLDGSAPLPGDVITDYPLGESRITVAASDGWPADGRVHTVRHPDGTGLQTLTAHAQTYTAQTTRAWSTDTDAWANWTGKLGAQAITLASGFSDSTGQAAAAYRSAEGTVFFRLAIEHDTETGAIPAHTTLGTLPAGYRPASQTYFNAVRIDADTTKWDAILYVTTAGEIKAYRNLDYEFTETSGAFEAA